MTTLLVEESADTNMSVEDPITLAEAPIAFDEMSEVASDSPILDSLPCEYDDNTHEEHINHWYLTVPTFISLVACLFWKHPKRTTSRILTKLNYWIGVPDSELITMLYHVVIDIFDICAPTLGAHLWTIGKYFIKIPGILIYNYTTTGAIMFAWYVSLHWYISKRNRVNQYSAKRKINYAAETERNLFHDIPMVRSTKRQFVARKKRARQFMDDFVSQSHKREFVIQTSTSENLVQPGIRTMFWDKDVVQEKQQDTIEPDDLLTIFDTDYYFNWIEWLHPARVTPLQACGRTIIRAFAWLFGYEEPTLPEPKHEDPETTNSVLLYTLTPSSAASTQGGFAYTFTANNELRVTIPNAHGPGGTFKHKLWDYSPNTVTQKIEYTDYYNRFLNWYRSKVGFPKEYAAIVTYGIEKRKLDIDHSIILCQPLVFAREVRLDVEAHHFTRFEPVTTLTMEGKEASFTMFKYQTPNNMMVVVGKPETYGTITITAQEYAELEAKATTGTVRITPYGVRSTLAATASDPGIVTKIKKKYCNQLVEFLRYKRGIVPPFYMRPSQGLIVYKPLIDPSTLVVNHEHKVSEQITGGLVTPFMNPLFPKTYTPAKCDETGIAAIQQRLEELRQPGYSPEAAVNQYSIEFAELLVPVSGCLEQLDNVDAIFSTLKRPTQRQLASIHIDNEPVFEDLIKAFVKAEAYGGIKPPRNISTVPASDKWEYARSMLPFAYYLKTTQQWYAFGRSNKENAERIARMATFANQILLTDYHRFDGTKQKPVRENQRRVLTRLFAPNEREEVLKNHSKHYLRKGVTMEGYMYKTDYTQLSGSMGTSAWNGVDNAFASYCGLRHSGESPQAAWAIITNQAVFGGDDGLICDMTQDQFEIGSALVGFVPTCDVIPRGEPGVTFLSRYFGPEVWEGDANTCCDISRQMSKFHTSSKTQAQLHPAEKLIEKCMSYKQTDGNTPLIGPLSTAVVNSAKVLRYADIRRVTLHDQMKLWNGSTRLALTEGGGINEDGVDYGEYENEEAGWMYDLLLAQEQTVDLELFDKWLKEAQLEFNMNLAAYNDEWFHANDKGRLLLLNAIFEPFLTPPVIIAIDDELRNRMSSPALVEDGRTGLEHELPPSDEPQGPELGKQNRAKHNMETDHDKMNNPTITTTTTTTTTRSASTTSTTTTTTTTTASTTVSTAGKAPTSTQLRNRKRNNKWEKKKTAKTYADAAKNASKTEEKSEGNLNSDKQTTLNPTPRKAKAPRKQRSIVYVNNLPPTFTETLVHENLGSCGTIENISLLRKRKPHVAKITYTTPEAATKARKCNSLKWGKHTMPITFKPDRPKNGRRRTPNGAKAGKPP